jgi:hypothetical protein
MAENREFPFEYGSDLHWLWSWGQRLEELLSFDRDLTEIDLMIVRPDRLAHDAMMRFSIDYQQIVKQIDGFLDYSEKRFAEYLKCKNDSTGANLEFALLDLSGRISEAVKIIAGKEAPQEIATISELLARIHQRRKDWPEPDDLNVFDPPNCVNEIWGAMIRLGLKPPPVPEMVSGHTFRHTVYFGNKDQRDRDELALRTWRQFHEALNIAQKTLEAASQSNADKADGAFDAREGKEHETADGAWFRSDPSEDSRYEYGPIETTLKNLADWMGIDQRTLRTNNGKSWWRINAVHRTKYRAWFTSLKQYAKINTKFLQTNSQIAPNDTK